MRLKQSPYRVSQDSHGQRRLTMNVQSKLLAPSDRLANYCSTTTASMVRSIHNSAARRDATSAGS